MSFEFFIDISFWLLTHPVIEMITRNISWEVKVADA
jgi:hypothetical protein